MKLSQMAQETSQKNVKDIKGTYEEYKDMSQDELMTKLTKEINKQKSKGNFDYEALKNTIEKISIYLPKQTYQNILKIIENFK